MLPETIFVITEDELDYDYEETPYLIGVTLHRAFTCKEDAQRYVHEMMQGWHNRDLTIKEVPFVK